jgi:hypothetical protein
VCRSTTYESEGPNAKAGSAARNAEAILLFCRLIDDEEGIFQSNWMVPDAADPDLGSLSGVNAPICFRRLLRHKRSGLLDFSNHPILL